MSHASCTLTPLGDGRGKKKKKRKKTLKYTWWVVAARRRTPHRRACDARPSRCGGSCRIVPPRRGPRRRRRDPPNASPRAEPVGRPAVPPWGGEHRRPACCAATRHPPPAACLGGLVSRPSRRDVAAPTSPPSVVRFPPTLASCPPLCSASLSTFRPHSLIPLPATSCAVRPRRPSPFPSPVGPPGPPPAGRWAPWRLSAPLPACRAGRRGGSAATCVPAGRRRRQGGHGRQWPVRGRPPLHPLRRRRRRPPPPPMGLLRRRCRCPTLPTSKGGTAGALARRL